MIVRDRPAGLRLFLILRGSVLQRIQVTLIEPNPSHVSCILSNLVMTGALGMNAITLRYDYSFSWGGLIATLAAIAGYFIFLVWQSDREYRQVIAEKFGNGS